MSNGDLLMTTLTLHNTSEWDYEAIDWPNVMTCLRRYIERYPKEATIESIMKELILGYKELWIVRDDDRTVSVVLISFETVLATGHCRCNIWAFAGNDGVEALFLLPQIEEHAREKGAEEIRIFGRRGWKRLLAPQGYDEEAIVLSKDL